LNVVETEGATWDRARVGAVAAAAVEAETRTGAVVAALVGAGAVVFAAADLRPIDHCFPEGTEWTCKRDGRNKKVKQKPRQKEPTVAVLKS
jgi:hypothetical protein